MFFGNDWSYFYPFPIFWLIDFVKSFLCKSSQVVCHSMLFSFQDVLKNCFSFLFFRIPGRLSQFYVVIFLSCLLIPHFLLYSICWIMKLLFFKSFLSCLYICECLSFNQVSYSRVSISNLVEDIDHEESFILWASSSPKAQSEISFLIMGKFINNDNIKLTFMGAYHVPATVLSTLYIDCFKWWFFVLHFI